MALYGIPRIHGISLSAEGAARRVFATNLAPVRGHPTVHLHSGSCPTTTFFMPGRESDKIKYAIDVYACHVVSFR